MILAKTDSSRREQNQRWVDQNLRLFAKTALEWFAVFINIIMIPYLISSYVHLCILYFTFGHMRDLSHSWYLYHPIFFIHLPFIHLLFSYLLIAISYDSILINNSSFQFFQDYHHFQFLGRWYPPTQFLGTTPDPVLESIRNTIVRDSI